MNLFSDCLDRLKPFLRVSKDQEVAAALGLSKTAFSERKKRGSFPDRELRALAQQRPELGIDVDYVLTGITTEAHARLDAKQARIERAVDAGMGMDEIRRMEAAASGQSTERLLSLGAMLTGMRVAEFDALYTLAKAITDMRQGHAGTALEPDGRYPAAPTDAAVKLHDKPRPTPSDER